MQEAQFNEIMQEISKGANVMVEWERPVKLKKAYGTMPLTKRTLMLCRIGVQYDNIQEVKDGREDGTLPAENAGLKGWEWVDYPITLRNVRNGSLYLRLESGTFANVKTVTQFFLDGQEVEKANYEHAMLSNEKKPRQEGHLTFNVKVEYIRRIHEYVAEVEAEAETV